MKITADTNVLTRAILQDDAAQCRAARDVLKDAMSFGRKAVAPFRSTEKPRAC